MNRHERIVRASDITTPKITDEMVEAAAIALRNVVGNRSGTGKPWGGAEATAARELSRGSKGRPHSGVGGTTS